MDYDDSRLALLEAVATAARDFTHARNARESSAAMDALWHALDALDAPHD